MPPYMPRAYEPAIIDVLVTLRRKTDQLFDQGGQGRVKALTFADFRMCGQILAELYPREADLVTDIFHRKLAEVPLVEAAAAGLNLQATRLLLETLRTAAYIKHHDGLAPEQVLRHGLGNVTRAIIELEMYLGVH